jgi:ferritin
MIGSYEEKNIIKKLQTLPKELLSEVEDFIDFLKAKHGKPQINTVKEPKSAYGSAKGLVKYISDDFNEPLDDFKEYM